MPAPAVAGAPVPVPAVPAVPVVVGRAATITAAQKSGVWAFFAAHDAVRWNKLVKKERIQELMAMDAYRNLKVSQISRQLEGFVVSAQLREQVGSRMYVYTDTVLEVVDGMEPDPATAAALPFAEDHMLLILMVPRLSSRRTCLQTSSAPSPGT